MLSEVIEFNNRYGLFDGCGSVIVGLSGGADSVALFHVLRELRSRYGFSIIAVHVHHGIRGEEADRDLDFAEIYATGTEWNCGNFFMIFQNLQKNFL